MAECLIRLERNDCGLQYAGQLLKGTVELHLNEPRMFRGEPMRTDLKPQFYLISLRSN